MSYDESQCPIPPHRGGKGNGRAHDARIRELALEAAKERSLAEQATRARNTAQARIRELEAELAKARQLFETAEEIASEEQKEHIEDFNAMVARAEKAEARVAELTEHLAVGHECTHRFHVEAREREAEYGV